MAPYAVGSKYNKHSTSYRDRYIYVCAAPLEKLLLTYLKARAFCLRGVGHPNKLLLPQLPRLDMPADRCLRARGEMGHTLCLQR